MFTFLILSIIDVRFGVLGILCMTAPLYQVLKGNGKVHCSHYCPRASIFNQFISKISLNNNMPSFMKSKIFKNIILSLMISMFSFAMYHTGGNYIKIGFAIFRFMGVSLAVGIIMGIIYKPRSWCAICPMGHASGLIDKKMKDSSSTTEKVPNAA